MPDPLTLSLSGEKLLAHNGDLEPHSLALTSAPATAVASHTTHVALGTSDGLVILHDPITLSVSKTIPAPTSAAITSLALSSTNLIAGHTDGTIALHETTTLHPPHLFHEPTSIISLSISSDTRHIAAATSTSITIISRNSHRQTRITPPSRPTKLCFSPLHPSLLATTDTSGTLTIHDISRRRAAIPHAKFSTSLRAPATDLCFLPTGELIVASFDKHIRIYNTSLKQVLFSTLLPSPISAIIARPDCIVAAMTDPSLATLHLDLATSKAFVQTHVRLPLQNPISSLLFVAASGSGAPEDEVGVDAFLHGLDHIMEPSVSERPLLDDDIFSPVEKRSPPLRLPPLPSIPYRAGTQGEADAAETPLVSRRRGLSGGRQWRIMGNGEGDEPGSGEKRSGNRRVSKDGNDDVEADNCIDLDTLADICLDSKVESPKSDPASVSSVDSNSPLSRPTEEILTNNKSANSASYAMPLGRLRSNRGSEGTKRFYRKTPVKAASLGNDASIRRGEGRSGGRGEGERRGRDDGNERDGEKTKLEVMSDMHRLQTKESVDLLESEGEKTGQQLLINEIRDIMKQELDVIRSDFRSDIHNIHAEIVIMASQHSQEMKNMISDRDAMVCTLKKEVNRLRADNLRLRQKYGLH